MKTVLGWLTALALGCSVPVSVAHNMGQASPQRPADWSAQPLGYACPAGAWTPHVQTGCLQPNGVTDQAIAAYDPWGDPLFVAGWNQDIASYGLAYTITPLGSLAGRMSMNWESPDTYQATLNFPPGCTVPHWEIAPSDDGTKLQIWHCVAPGVWHLYKTL